MQMNNKKQIQKFMFRKIKMFLFAWLFFIEITRQAAGHGWLDSPVARSSAWLYNNKYNFSFPSYYMHTQMNCGGFEILEQNG